MGEGVAVVVAEDRYAAHDVLEHVEVDYEPLLAAVDVEAALEAGAALVHEEYGTNECYTWPLSVGDVGGGRHRHLPARLGARDRVVPDRG